MPVPYHHHHHHRVTGAAATARRRSTRPAPDASVAHLGVAPRHARLVNKCLADEMKTIHAFTQVPARPHLRWPAILRVCAGHVSAHACARVCARTHMCARVRRSVPMRARVRPHVCARERAVCGVPPVFCACLVPFPHWWHQAVVPVPTAGRVTKRARARAASHRPGRSSFSTCFSHPPPCSAPALKRTCQHHSLTNPPPPPPSTHARVRASALLPAVHTGCAENVYSDRVRKQGRKRQLKKLRNARPTFRPTALTARGVAAAALRRLQYTNARSNLRRPAQARPRGMWCRGKGSRSACWIFPSSANRGHEQRRWM